MKPVERTLVNLAIATGVLAAGLKLDQSDYRPAGAMGCSTSDFEFRPHSSDSTVVNHEGGQVDIDLLFVARRNGIDVAFVLEAKYDKALQYDKMHPRSTLAKSKLLFPVLAICARVPAGMPIVPAYLKAVVGTYGVDFYIAECSPYRGGDEHVSCVDEMRVVRRCSFRLPVKLPVETSAFEQNRRSEASS